MDIPHVYFNGANQHLGAPSNWDRQEPCDALWVQNDDGLCISCWRPSFIQRVMILIGRPVWLHVVGNKQPPVMLTVGWGEPANKEIRP